MTVTCHQPGVACKVAGKSSKNPVGLTTAPSAVCSRRSAMEDLRTPVRSQAVKQNAELWSALEFFATAHSFRERVLESGNCTGLTLPMSMGFSASSHHAGMSAPAHHAQMSTPTYHSGMSSPTHHSGLSEPTQHAGVFSVLSLPVCWLQRTSVDCLSQRNTQVPPPFLTECAGGRPQHITVDCLRPIDVFFFLQACGEVLVGNTGHFDNEIDLVGSEGVDGHLVLLKRWPARSSSTQWAPTA